MECFATRGAGVGRRWRVPAFALATMLASGCDTTAPLNPAAPSGPGFTPPPPAAVTLATVAIVPAAIVGGGAVQGTATLSAAAPAGGLVLALASSDSVATVPASITVAAGATSATFPITTRAVSVLTDLTVTATGGGETRTASLQITPVPALAALAVDRLEVVGGSPAQLTITLNGAAPTGGTPVPLNGQALDGGTIVLLSSNNAVATVPESFTIPAGATRGTATITTARTGRSQLVVITVTVGGVTQTLELRVSPVLPEVPVLTSLSPASGNRGETVNVSLTGDHFVAGWGLAVEVRGSGVAVSNLRVISRTSLTATFALGADAAIGARDVTVTIAGRSSAARTFTVDAPPPGNSAPVADDDAYSTNEDTVLIVAAPGVLVGDTDLNGDPLAAVLNAGPTNGALTLNADGSFTYTPAANFAGTDTFTYRASDGTATSNLATVTITASAVNDGAPVANDDSYTTDEDVALTVGAPGVLANDTDVDGDTLTAVLGTGPANGLLTLNAADGSFTYTPNANFNGSDSFTYRASDGVATSNVATVTIAVSGSNDAPVASDDSYTTDEDTPLTVAAAGVLANDTDVDGDTLTAVPGTGPANGALTLNADGSFTYTPDADFNGADSFTYRASDGTATSNVATVTISVAPVNDPYTAMSNSFVGDVLVDGTTQVCHLQVNLDGEDVDGDARSFEILTLPETGTLYKYNNGDRGNPVTVGYYEPTMTLGHAIGLTLCFQPVVFDFVGSPYASFTFRVSDGAPDIDDTETSNVATIEIEIRE